MIILSPAKPAALYPACSSSLVGNIMRTDDVALGSPLSPTAATLQWSISSRLLCNHQAKEVASLRMWFVRGVAAWQRDTLYSFLEHLHKLYPYEYQIDCWGGIWQATANSGYHNNKKGWWFYRSCIGTQSTLKDNSMLPPAFLRVRLGQW